MLTKARKFKFSDMILVISFFVACMMRKRGEEDDIFFLAFFVRGNP